jgi:lysine 2,3-aminomutase
MTKPLRHARDLAAARLIASDRVAALDAVGARYAIAVSPALASLMTGGEADPIARQFLPSEAELIHLAEESSDPIGDTAHSPVPGIVHRHKDRVLLKIVSACPVYCRFCFRRETVGPNTETSLSPEAFETALAYISAHPEIWEVILTGGDPFILSPRRIAQIAHRLARIPHVKIVRWHTRVPVVDPERVTDEMAAALKSGGATTWVAIHANHAREFSKEARAAIARLADAGIPLVSQTVLLKGVNDSADTLDVLMRTFVENRIKPYYLHHPDLAPGTSHFRVSIDEGLALMKSLRARLSGLATPTYVLDIPGGYAKVPLESHSVEKLDDNHWRIRDPEGREHIYPPSDIRR